MPLIGRRNLDKAIEDAVDDLDNKLSAIYIHGLNQMVRMTPVHFKDGGRLKNNWFLSVASPSSKTRDDNVAGSASFAEVGSMPKTVRGKKIFFSNNLPYANTVEYGGYPNPPSKGTNTSETKGKPKYQKLSSGGYSRQFPEGMVRINIKKMKARIKKL